MKLGQYETNHIYNEDCLLAMPDIPAESVDMVLTDYDFITKSVNWIGYICGMSVPPVMIKRVAPLLTESKIFEAKEAL